MYQFTDEQNYNLQVISSCSSILSFLGALFITIMYTCNKHLRGFGFRLIFYLALSDLICGFGHLLNFRFLSSPSKALCITQAFIINFAGLSSILWTTVIAYTVYKIVSRPYFYYRRYEKYYLLYAYAFPFVLSLIPFITDDYGEGSGWCWIRLYEDDNGKQDLYIVFIEFYGPLWVAFFFNLFTYWRASVVVRGLLKDCHELNLINKLHYYPMVLIFCWSLGTFNRIYIFFQEPVYWVSCIHAVLGTVQGFLNAVLYGMNERVKHTIKLKLKSCFGIKSDEGEKEILTRRTATESQIMHQSDGVSNNNLLRVDGVAGYIQNKSLESPLDEEKKEGLLSSNTNRNGEVALTSQKKL